MHLSRFGYYFSDEIQYFILKVTGISRSMFELHSSAGTLIIRLKGREANFIFELGCANWPDSVLYLCIRDMNNLTLHAEIDRLWFTLRKSQVAVLSMGKVSQIISAITLNFSNRHIFSDTKCKNTLVKNLKKKRTSQDHAWVYIYKSI